MEDFPRKRRAVSGFMIQFAVIAVILEIPLRADQVSLQAVVTPSTTILKDGRPVTFAIHGFIEFKSLSELFPYIESQTRRWKPDRDIEGASGRIRQELLRRGIESRVVSMIDERPLEALVTHTSEELRQAISALKEPVPPGYAEAFLAVQQKWKHSLNCWSASPSIPGRVLSNWYPIEEGIRLYGATYDSTEHFWQAVKYHPDTTVGDLKQLIGVLEHKDWNPWLERLDGDPRLYLPNAYAVEFLRHNLALERLRWFGDELGRHGLKASDRARLVQQRIGASFRFSAREQKDLWGDLADVLHLVYTFSAPDEPIRETLADHHFDAVYLDERKLGFISEQFRWLMFEIWKVKYLQTPRFREVISSIPIEIRLEHFLNDGDSPDIPIPIYVEYLNQIRNLARKP
ncbi:MAG: hypothetical protein AUH15_08745 [Acidobacteriales bacterium 13_2_20CM_55_8]|nr:MAG: hypothetical protein AUH15_08745 [Acidobacteriales bacterium 13_2_20CM_55_8]